MDGSLEALDISRDRAWISETEAEIRSLLLGRQFGAVEDYLLKAIVLAESELSHPMPLTQIFWAMRSLLPERGTSETVDALFESFEAFHAIDLYTFQTLHSEAPFRVELEAAGLTPSRISTPIWMAWKRSDGRSPTEIASEWLDEQHRLLGFGPLFSLDEWNPSQQPGAVSQATEAEILAFERP